MSISEYVSIMLPMSVDWVVRVASPTELIAKANALALYVAIEP